MLYVDKSLVDTASNNGHYYYDYYCYIFIFLDGNRRQSSITVQARVDETKTLKCPVDQTNNALTNWYKDGASISHSADFRMKRNELRISNLRKEDQGFYKCEVVDGYKGSLGTGNFSLFVYGELKKKPANFLSSHTECLEPIERHLLGIVVY